MEVKVIGYEDHWQEVKDLAMNTIGKNEGTYPSSEWKRKMLMAEHSPIRAIEFTVRITDVPYYVVMHLVRHKIGVEHFVSTQRTDRTGVQRDNLPQGALVSYIMKINAQALINISRKRLCGQAAPETRKVWKVVIEEIRKREPELADMCVPECVRDGFCPEMKSCGYIETERFWEERALYINRRGD